MAERGKQWQAQKHQEGTAASYIPDDITAELVYLYRLVEGTSTNSHGYHCAIKAGMPVDVIQRAEQVSAQLVNNEPIMRIDCEKDETSRRRADAIVSLFNKLDLQHGDLLHFFAQIQEIASPHSAPSTS